MDVALLVLGMWAILVLLVSQVSYGLAIGIAAMGILSGMALILVRWIQSQ